MARHHRRVGTIFVVGAFGPEAQVDPRGFEWAVRLAAERIAEVERRHRES